MRRGCRELVLVYASEADACAECTDHEACEQDTAFGLPRSQGLRHCVPGCTAYPSFQYCVLRSSCLRLGPALRPRPWTHARGRRCLTFSKCCFACDDSGTASPPRIRLPRQDPIIKRARSNRPRRSPFAPACAHHGRSLLLLLFVIIVALCACVRSHTAAFRA